MTIEADNPVGRSHDDMEIVRNQQDPAVQFIAYPLDQLVQGNLAAEIHALHRLVKNQKFGRRAIARASMTRWNSPPESVRTSAFARCATPVDDMAAPAAASLTLPVRRMNLPTVSGKVQSIVSFWGT
jgi:hypothetical protein